MRLCYPNNLLWVFCIRLILSILSVWQVVYESPATLTLSNQGGIRNLWDWPSFLDNSQSLEIWTSDMARIMGSWDGQSAFLHRIANKTYRISGISGLLGIEQVLWTRRRASACLTPPPGSERMCEMIAWCNEMYWGPSKIEMSSRHSSRIQHVDAAGTGWCVGKSKPLALVSQYWHGFSHSNYWKPPLKIYLLVCSSHTFLASSSSFSMSQSFTNATTLDDTSSNVTYSGSWVRHGETIF